MKLNDLIKEFDYKLTAKHLKIAEYSKSELALMLREIIKNITLDYETYRVHIPKLLYSLEKNDKTSIVILIDTYFFYYNNLLVCNNTYEINTTLFSSAYDESVVDKIHNVFRNSDIKGKVIRLSEPKFDISSLINFDKLEIISFEVDHMREKAKKMLWEDAIIQDTLLELTLLRTLLLDQKDYDIFYFTALILIERLGSSENFQASRDLTEELIICAYQDKKPHYGFLTCFRSYTTSNSLISGLIYANLSFCCALKDTEKICFKYIKETIWQGVKFFRNVSLHSWVKDIYESIPSHIKFEDFEKRSIQHSYITSLLMSQDQNVIQIISDFLDVNREHILQGGIGDIQPWLITLYNVNRIYPDSIKLGGLDNYLRLFESIVPPDLIIKEKAIIKGDLELLKKFLIESLIKLNETRNSSDIDNDNKMSLNIANRIIQPAVQKNDFEALILAMIVKADFSVIFEAKKSIEIAPLKIPETDVPIFDSIYGNITGRISKLSKEKEFVFVWLISSETHIYQLSYSRGIFECKYLEHWDYKRFRQLINNNFFLELKFDDVIKTESRNKHQKPEVRDVLPEEHVQQSNEYKSNFEFAQIYSTEDPILIIPDMNFAGFPHNLYLNNQSNPVYLKQPICNILSTEWYLQNSNKTKLKNNYTKSIWIPAEGGDFTINQLYGKLETILSSQNFIIQQSLDPIYAISSDLNIVVSHGPQDIATKQVIYPDSNPRLNLNKYLGKGEILILLICHSGSTEATPYKNSVSSIVKNYIQKGYKAVIAPFWLLHINILPIWLPTFLKLLNEGKNIITAVHHANLEVYKEYPTISAWACMHLYGDPHMSLAINQ